MAINSIDELEIPGGILETGTDEAVIENKEAIIEGDISSLIAAKVEYSKKE